jgi:hypothetical protein
MNASVAALLLAAAAHPAPQSVEVAGVRVTITPTDIRIVRSGQPVYSLRERFRAENEAMVRQATRLLAGQEDRPHTDGVSTTEYMPLSLVGPYLSLQVSEGGFWPGMPHPSGSSHFKVIDVRDPRRLLALDELFPPDAIRDALVKDPIVAEYLALGTSDPNPRTNSASQPVVPRTLAALVSKLEHASDYDRWFSFLNLLKGFAFYGVGKDRVAVRIGLPPLYNVPPYDVTQLGIWLPIPPALRADLEAADAGTAGFLMEKGPSATIKMHFEKDLRPLAEAARAKKKKSAAGSK